MKEELKDKKITISASEYYDLKLSQETLSRLECGGVDNWEWHGESLNPDDEEDLDAFEENLEKEILEKIDREK